jgi:hypothetical protein
MERPYLDKWQQYLLREAKGPEKPPYFKNIYGGTLNVTTANAKEVAKTMSRILKQTVTIVIPTDFESYSPSFRKCINSKGETVYMETDQYWRQAYFKGDNSYYWGSDGQETVIADHDKNWDYRRIIWKEDGFKKRYYVSKKDNTKLKMNRQLMEPQYAGDVWAELRPGTKAYDAVKRDVFKEK